MKFASNAKGNLGVVLGSLGTAALVGQMGGGCGNGLLGNIFGGNGSRTGNCEPMETKEASCLRQQVATLQAEKYADGVGIETFKAALALSEKNDAHIRENQKEAFQAIATLDKQAAVNQANFDCLASKLGETVVRVNRLEEGACDARVRETQLGANLTALASDTRQAIALEAERRAAADQAIRCWVEGTYVPGTLSLSPDSMCPKPVTCCDVLRYANNGGTMPVPAPCGCSCGCSAPASAA